jgi:hypothetical protein
LDLGSSKQNWGPAERPDAIDIAILSTLPEGYGQRERKLFLFARKLKSIPALAGADFCTLKPIFHRWFVLALANIQTKCEDTSWHDFQRAWQNVKVLAGNEPVRLMFNQALAASFPPAAVQYSSIEAKQLVALCSVLQANAGTEPFFIDCRTAGQLISKSHTIAWKFLQMFVNDGVLKCEETGRMNRASRYRYIGD